jgi:hypothetical protein
MGNKGKMLDMCKVEVIEKGESKGFLETEETGEINFACIWISRTDVMTSA